MTGRNLWSFRIFKIKLPFTYLLLNPLPLGISFHNDTKISNILFKKDFEKVVAIVDFDTIMPGYVIHDFGDLVRSICNTAEEDEENANNVRFDEHLFKAIAKGYITGLKTILTIEEKENLVFWSAYYHLHAIHTILDRLPGW